ncbi:MAG: tetratricopeptide repeat protein [Chloroflexi bacterium]|nr:tetratricopeptide repeat protein [Chloroflexota bacterium]
MTLKAMIGAGVLARSQGAFEQARAFLEEALRRCEQAADAAGEAALTLINLGAVAEGQGDYEQAMALFIRSLESYERLADRRLGMRGMGHALANCGVVSLHQDDIVGARDLFAQSLRTFREIRDEWSAALAMRNLAFAELLEGDHRRAGEHFQESLKISQGLGDKRAIANTLSGLGFLSSRQGDHEAALALFARGLATFKELDNQPGVLECLEGIAGEFLADREAADRGVQVMSAVQMVRTARGLGAAPFPFYQRTYQRALAAARSQLGEARFSAARKVGEATTLEEAIASVQEIATRGGRSG